MRIAPFVLTLGAALLLGGGHAAAQADSASAEPFPTVRQPTPAQPRGWTGFSIRFAMTMGPAGASNEQPLVIGTVAAGSPAERAGLAPGDVILEVDGRDARAPGAMRLRPGIRYTFRIRRGDQEREVALVPIPHPDDVKARS